MQKRLILTAGINSTGYLADSWRHVGGSPFVFAEFDHYLRATRIAHAGTLDAVFFQTIRRSAPILRSGRCTASSR
ncbi:hypothetical protein [Rhizobium leguminosarum]|uniref:hypothetical protein n=1 Tax=Rhizobium leguminosarum TaxID=384 RepID=UPI00351779CA